MQDKIKIKLEVSYSAYKDLLLEIPLDKVREATLYRGRVTDASDIDQDYLYTLVEEHGIAHERVEGMDWEVVNDE